MITTELIKILKDNEYGGISHKPREISLTINGKYMPNPQITLSSTGDGICGAEIDLDVDGKFFTEQEPKTEWILVDERLPKAFEFVNCTCHSLIDDREDWVIETVYLPQFSNSPYSDWGNIPMLNCGDCKVVAWMHRDIPAPYKLESEE